MFNQRYNEKKWGVRVWPLGMEKSVDSNADSWAMRSTQHGESQWAAFLPSAQSLSVGQGSCARRKGRGDVSHTAPWPGHGIAKLLKGCWGLTLSPGDAWGSKEGFWCFCMNIRSLKRWLVKYPQLTALFLAYQEPLPQQRELQLHYGWLHSTCFCLH